MELQFVPVGETQAESAALAELLSGDEWPFHGTSRPSRETAEGWLAAGRFTGSGVRSFWIRVAEADAAVQAGRGRAEVVAGIVTLRDLADPTAVFDLRLRSGYRGRGFGSAALRWLTGYLFTEFPQIRRIEGHTRRVHDSFGYAILRQDWLSGGITPVEL